MILATRHTGIVVRDIEESLRFWRDVMGLKVEVDFREKGAFIDTVQGLCGVDLRILKLRAPDGSTIELLEDAAHPTRAPEHNRLCERGIRHVAFTVADIEAAWKRLQEAGCDVLSAPVTAPDGKARLFFARDPEGNLMELVQMLG